MGLCDIVPLVILLKVFTFLLVFLLTKSVVHVVVVVGGGGGGYFCFVCLLFNHSLCINNLS